MTDAGTGPTPGPGPSGQWAQRSEREPPGGGEPGPEPVDRELQAHPEHVEGPDEGRLVLGGSEPVDGDGHGAPLAGIAQFELTRSYQAYRGPLPSPADFSGFEQVLPGAANRILRMAEQRQRAGSPSYAPVAPADSRRRSRPKPLIATTATPIARAAQAAEYPSAEVSAPASAGPSVSPAA